MGKSFIEIIMNKITKLYSISHWFYVHKMTILARFIQRYIRLCYSAIIPYQCKISKTVIFAHNALGVVINSSTIIGENCIIYQNVTIGNRNSSKGPIIKNNVMIGANAVIIGNIIIGNNVKIGAGSIIVHNVPDNATMVSQCSFQIK